MTTTNYVQLPPDGVGKKVRHRVITDIKVTSVTNVPAVGAVVYGNTSGAYGTLVGSYNAEDTTWYFKDVTGTFVAGETLRNVGNTVSYGTASVITLSVNTPAINLADPKIPEHILSVDKRGAALTSFPEGTPQFDAWGRQQLSQMLAVGEYYHFSQDLAGKYYTATNGGSAAVKHSIATSSMVYTTGTGSGEYAKRITAQYHPYKPGVSQLVYTSIAIGDTGKANVIREWGYFDDYNGFGFRLDGTTLKVFYRSDSNGAPTDVEVSQANWNINTLDSATSSDYLLNVSKSNLYWMDIQGTVGRIRLGVETPDGRRITCHEFRNINNIDGPSMRNLSLPLQWGQRNIGAVSSSPASTQTLRVGAGVVFTESADVQYTGVLTHIIPDDPVPLTDDQVYKPFLQFKAKNTVAGPTQTAGNFTVGYSYTIVSVGDTDFTLIGASDNVVGVAFIATGAGSGTGTAHANIPNSIIGIHETFDWASQGNANIHVGIFVHPNEKWFNNMQWSETIQPQTMLYVDTDSTAMAQYRYWDTKATGIEGSISTTTLTVTAVTGALLREMYLTAPPLYAAGPLYIDGTAAYASVTGAVTARTRITTQLTGGTGTQVAAPTYGTQAGGSGVAGSNKLVISSATGVAAGQLINGTNLPNGTFIESITGTTLILSKAFTGTGSGTYNCFTPGGVGTYKIDKPQTVASLVGYGAYYPIRPIESFIAPANSVGRAALGDRIEKSFGLGPVPGAEDGKGVFSFAAKPLATTGTLGTVSLMYTKYWKEIR